jgi:type I restriction enzyme R subunit
MLDVPYAISSNGDGFLIHDLSQPSGKLERQVGMDGLPSPDEMWAGYKAWKGIAESSSAVVAQDYHGDLSGKTPRYYQTVAINRTVEAVAKGQNRILLVMATGTGKTYTAFQIIWRLWKSGQKKRILFLADRNILVDQTKTNDFKPFGQALTKITNRTVNKAFEVYLALYQAVSGTEDERDIYKQFSPDFFDLIVIDECHRGSAAEASAWRAILDYFSSATHLGMTATPKETKDVSNITYFGEPVYTYSLRQGIQDGFLAPYKVVRIDFDKDLQGWRPEKGKTDDAGELIEDRVYNQKDFDRTLVLDKRTILVAKKVSELLRGTSRYDKTIVFCEDIDHAERMRQALSNANPDLAAKDRRYVMRITGDNPEGKAELDNFIDPESRYPVLVTTSKLMTTGVDAQTCKLVVLDRTIKSMTEFKQIIGRGTRINEDYGKLFFTIMDFRKATELFADPDFDGDPVVVFNPKPDDDLETFGESVEGEDGDEGHVDTTGGFVDPLGTGGDESGEAGQKKGGKRQKYFVGDVEVLLVAERVQYYGKDGKLITESLKEYTRKAVRKEYRSLDDFLRSWNESDKKQAILEQMREEGVLFEALAEDVGKDYGAFDLVCHVAFDQPPLTRKERAENVRKRNYFTKYGDQARAVLEALLTKYADEGIEDMENTRVLTVQPISTMGTPMEIIKQFGGRAKYLQAVKELEDELYRAS